MEKKRCCVVGCGVAGLVTMKQLIEEGIEPICLDKSDDIGGLWNYREAAIAGQPSLFNSVYLNTSKEMTAFSDFPMPKSFPNCMHHSQYKQYLDSYAKKFNLQKYLKLKTEVISMQKEKNGDHTKNWSVTWKNKNGDEKSDEFDFVVVCNGHDYKPDVPKFEGMEDFSGQLMHSHDFKESADWEGKTVVVVGVGNSAADIATCLSRRCRKVILSVRGGTDVTTRMRRDGRPYDHVAYTRFRNRLPYQLKRFLDYKKVRRQNIYPFFHRKPFLPGIKTINDHLISEIVLGNITVKDNIQNIRNENIKFADDTVEKADVIILATGYTYEIPFLPDISIKTESGVPNTYKMCFPIQNDGSRSNLAIVGLLNATGPRPVVVELQARWVARVFAEKTNLPPSEEQIDWVTKRTNAIVRTYDAPVRPRYALKVDYMNYMLDIAREVGCSPNLIQTLVTDPILWYKLVFGPLTSQQWRLRGSGSWDGSRNAILNVSNNTRHPLKTRPKKTVNVPVKHKTVQSMTIMPCNPLRHTLRLLFAIIRR